MPLVWPDAAAYREALQNPRTCFIDEELREAAPTTDLRGFPKAWAGNFAVVFQVRTGGKVRAVRCFQGDVGDRQLRYEAVDRHLSAVQSASITHFEYVAQGIRVGSNSFPLLIMDWVDGLTLDQYVRSVSPSAEVFRALANRWVEIVRDLESAGIAHGDLQHGNILVSGGDLRLVDYDGMFVPALRGRKSIESGHRAYQHPQRGEDSFGPDVDRFSALVIYATLISLAHRPELVARCTGEYLLFRADDYRNPRTASVFSELAALSPEVARIVEAVRASCLANVAATPRLLDLATAPPASKLPGWMRSTAEIPNATHVHVDPPRDRDVLAPSNAPRKPLADPNRASPPAWMHQSAAKTAVSTGVPQGARQATRRRVDLRYFGTRILLWFIGVSFIGAAANINANAVELVLLVGSIIIAIRSFREVPAGQQAAAQPPIAQTVAPQSWSAPRVTLPARNPLRPAPTKWNPPLRGRGISAASSSASYGSGQVIGSSIRSKYHRPSCEWVRKMSPRNRITFASAAAAQRAGYRPCRVCRP